jgi:hypothetical protein
MPETVRAVSNAILLTVSLKSASFVSREPIAHLSRAQNLVDQLDMPENIILAAPRYPVDVERARRVR